VFWKRATRQGAITSILAGTVTALVWEEMHFVKEALPRWVSGLDAVLPAITISVIALAGVSLLTSRKTATSML